MIGSFVRAVSFGAAALGAMVVAQAASATAFTFDFTNKGSYVATTAGSVTGAAATPQSFSSTIGAASVNVKVTAWHANDPNANALTSDSIDKAKLGYWSNAGMGVLYGTDNANDGTHQIDNVGGGVDFIMLQFDQDVNLASIGRNVYSMANAGVACCDSQAAYWADTTKFLGGASSTSAVDLANGSYTVNENLFGSVAANGLFNTNKTASVWLVSAAFNQSNDGFKISNIVVNTAGPVPEPATWATMLVGFGAIGYGLRRRRSGTAAIA